MSDWKKDLVKISGDKGGETMKKCKKCGEPVNNPRFDLCYKCSQKDRGSYNQGSHTSSPVLPQDYLEGGYFDDKGNLKERYLAKGGDADLIAKQLGDVHPKLTNHQLRRFFSHARNAENRLKTIHDFGPILVQLKKLDSFVSEAKGKGKVPDLFYNVILNNIKAVRTEKDFSQGFMEHFQAIVGFFTYHYPKN